MNLIDAHCHASPLWFEPVETLLFQMDRCGVAKGVLTQILGQVDNSYQQDCVRDHPDRLASVGAIDAASTDAVDLLQRWADRGMAGLRLRPEARSPGDDPLALWRAAAQRGLAISCGGTSANILSPDFAALVESFPDLVIVLEQLGGWTRPDCDRTPETWAGIKALARFPNIMLKLPTLGQFVPRAVGTPLPADGPVLDASQGAGLLEMAAAFGPERVMWGSDHPVVASREGYANALNWTRDLFADHAAAAVAQIFGDTADRVFFGCRA